MMNIKIVFVCAAANFFLLMACPSFSQESSDVRWQRQLAQHEYVHPVMAVFFPDPSVVREQWLGCMLSTGARENGYLLVLIGSGLLDNDEVLICKKENTICDI